MYKQFLSCVICFLLVLGSSTILAEESDDIKKITNALNKFSPGLKADAIVTSPVSGIYEVGIGSEVMYVSADGNFMFQGDLIDLKQMKNLTESHRERSRAKLIAGMKAGDMVTFAPEKIKHTITVFTDIDCGYCRKLHREIEAYNKLGIAVRYLAFPRSGVNTESYFKTVSVWCADDRKAAMTAAKTGQPLESNQCSNHPVKKHMAMGEMVGVRGTPSMVLENGTFIPGYVPAERLYQILERNASPK